MNVWVLILLTILLISIAAGQFLIWRQLLYLNEASKSHNMDVEEIAATFGQHLEIWRDEWRDSQRERDSQRQQNTQSRSH